MLSFTLIPEAEAPELRALAAKVGRGSAIGRCADHILQSHQIHPHQEDELVRALDPAYALSFTWRERALAAWLLGFVKRDSPAWVQHKAALAQCIEPVDALRDDLLRVRFIGSSWRAFTHTVRWARLPVVVLVFMALWSTGIFREGWAIGVLAGLMLSFIALMGTGIFLIPFVAPVCHYREVQVQVIAARSLGRLKDPRYLFALAGASADLITIVRETATKALMETLPEVRPEHLGALPSETVPRLCHLLGRADETLAEAILQALTFIGDGRAIPAVKRVSQSSSSKQTRQRAIDLLPTLEDRLHRSRLQESLLRATVNPTSDDMTLLRAPAESVSDSSTLVRPASPD